MLDEEDKFDHEAYQREKETRPDQIDNALFPDYGDDYDDYAQKRRRKLFSLVTRDTNSTLKNTSDARLHIHELQRRQERDGVPQTESQKPVEPLQSVSSQASKHHLQLQQNRTELNPDGRVKKIGHIKQKGKVRPAKRPKLKSVETTVRTGQTNPTIQAEREQLKAQERPVFPSEPLIPKQRHIQRSRKTNHTQIQRVKGSKLQPLERDAPVPEKPTAAKHQMFESREKHLTTPKRGRPLVRLSQRDKDARKHLRDKEIEMNMPLQQDVENGIHKAKMIARGKEDKKRSDTKGEELQAGEEEDKMHNRELSRRDTREGERDSVWGPGEDFEGTDDEDLTPAPVFDAEVNWNQTFQVSHLDLQAQRSDWIDLRCNISGNLLLHSSDTLPLAKAFMDQLNEKHHR